MTLRHRLFARRRFAATPAAACGFTLVEILTATAIMALLVSLVMTILSQIVAAWNRSSDELAIGGVAHQALDTIAADLEMAIFRNDGGQWLACKTEQTPNSPISGITNTRLIFFAPTHLRQAKDNTSTSDKDNTPINGDICLIEYRVTYGDPFGNSASNDKTFSLHRVALDPATTLFGVNGNALLGLKDNGGFAATLPDALDKTQVDTSTDVVRNSVQGNQGKTLTINLRGTSSYETILLDNVARFNVFLFYVGYNPKAGVAPITQIYPQSFPSPEATEFYFGGERPGSEATRQPQFINLISNATDSSNPTFIRLAFADVTITVLKEEGVTLLNTFSGSLPEGLTWEDFLKQYGRTYTERVYFYNSPG